MPHHPQGPRGVAGEPQSLLAKDPLFFIRLGDVNAHTDHSFPARRGLQDLAFVGASSI
jgi:hypothetical protein